MAARSPTPPPEAAPTSGFDFARPLSGNIEMYKSLWGAYRTVQKSGPHPPLLVRLLGRLWLPLDVIGIIGMTFGGQGPVFLDWAIVAGMLPRMFFELLVLIHLLPRDFFGRRTNAAFVALELFLLAYLVSLAFDARFLWATPVVLAVLAWRLSRQTGGLGKTLLLIFRAAQVQGSVRTAGGGASTPAPRGAASEKASIRTGGLSLHSVSRSSLKADGGETGADRAREPEKKP